MSARQVILVGVILGIVAAAVLWAVEGYRVRLIQAEFKQWLDRLPETGGGEGGGD